jgi:hypothetical protein
MHVPDEENLCQQLIYLAHFGIVKPEKFSTVLGQDITHLNLFHCVAKFVSDSYTPKMKRNRLTRDLLKVEKSSNVSPKAMK